MARYWFRQKNFGYGATPNTWQGWVATLVSVALVFAIVLVGPYIRDNGLRAVWILAGLVVVLVPFCALSWLKTEGGWRWRNGND